MSLLKPTKRSVDAKPFAKHMKEVHEHELQSRSIGYKKNIGLKRHVKIFEEGNLVLANLKRKKVQKHSKGDT